MTSVETLEEQIKQQGELVRKLKEQQADKERIKEEVAKLLDLKGQTSNNQNVRQKFVVKTPKGSRDFSPEQMSLRSYVLGMIEGIFEKNGAKTIDTPLFEFKEVLTEKYGEDSKLIYDLEEYDDEVLSLRYDLTVPFARYLGKNNIKNFKRYQIAPVYRRDNPSIARGRFREFYQCDLDIAGSYEPMEPDAECIRIVYEILNVLELKPFVIKINHRSLLDGMLEVCGVPADKFRSICSAVDKLDKSPWLEVKKEMIEEKGLTEDVVDKIGEYVRLNGGVELVDQLLENQDLIKSKSAVNGLEAIKILLKYCESQGTLDAVSFDLSLARGLDYYTGVIYEAVLSGKDSGETDEFSVGSVAGGGRYDNLVGMFNPNNETVPCVGVSIGIERIFTVLDAKYAASNKKMRTTEVEVYIATAQKNLFSEKIKLCFELSHYGVRFGFSYKKNPKLLVQLQHCEEHDIPYAIILGESEIEKGVVKLRKVSTREEVEIPRKNLMEELFNRLKNNDMTKDYVHKVELQLNLKGYQTVNREFTEDTPKGTIDYSQEQMALRKDILKTVDLIFKKNGAESISTPVFELTEVFKDKYGDGSKLVYDLKDQGGEKLSLRYDLTVPLARYLAMNKKMSMICSQIAKVYRRDNPSIKKGVHREFYQADFDVVGSYDTMIPEAHCIWIIHDVLNALRVPPFIIKINHKVLLDAILDICGVPADKIKSVCSSMNKLDRLPMETVGKELIKEKGLSRKVTEEIGSYARRYGGNNLLSFLSKNEALMKKKGVAEALKDIELLLDYCLMFQISSAVVLDLGLSRNLDYYTGIMFEAELIGEDYGIRDENSVGSLAGGGRYDNLVGTFDSKKKSVPCVGFSIGIDRVFSVLENEISLSGKVQNLASVRNGIDEATRNLSR